jgi:hypothetical protein
MPHKAANRVASSRGNHLASIRRTRMTDPKNALPKAERTRSRIGKNRTRVDSGEHHNVLDLSPGVCVGAA